MVVAVKLEAMMVAVEVMGVVVAACAVIVDVKTVVVAMVEWGGADACDE